MAGTLSSSATGLEHPAGSSQVHDANDGLLGGQNVGVGQCTMPGVQALRPAGPHAGVSGVRRAWWRASRCAVSGSAPRLTFGSTRQRPLQWGMGHWKPGCRGDPSTNRVSMASDRCGLGPRRIGSEAASCARRGRKGILGVKGSRRCSRPVVTSPTAGSTRARHCGPSRTRADPIVGGRRASEPAIVQALCQRTRRWCADASWRGHPPGVM